MSDEDKTKMNQEDLKRHFFKENPFAETAHQAYLDVPVNTAKDPLFFALMALAYEVWIKNSVQ